MAITDTLQQRIKIYGKNAAGDLIESKGDPRGEPTRALVTRYGNGASRMYTISLRGAPLPEAHVLVMAGMDATTIFQSYVADIDYGLMVQDETKFVLGSPFYPTPAQWTLPTRIPVPEYPCPIEGQTYFYEYRPLWNFIGLGAHYDFLFENFNSQDMRRVSNLRVRMCVGYMSDGTPFKYHIRDSFPIADYWASQNGALATPSKANVGGVFNAFIFGFAGPIAQQLGINPPELQTHAHQIWQNIGSTAREIGMKYITEKMTGIGCCQQTMSTPALSNNTTRAGIGTRNVVRL